MPYIHKSGKQFGLADISITNGVQCREITQAQYDALSTAEKNNGTVYFITDGKQDNLYISDTIPIGAIQAYGGTEAPDGWLMCDGSAINRIVYRDLFAVIGTTYGEGDTVTTFNLPNLKGRIAVGAGTGYVLGAEGGNADATLVAHSHTLHVYNDDFSNAGDTQTADKKKTSPGFTYDVALGANGWDYSQISTEGSSAAGANMQPYVVTNYIIKAKDTYQVGSSGSGGGGYVDVDSTAIPAPNMISEFDDDAKMNSTDMTDAEIESYFDTITYNPLIVNDTVPIGAIQAYGGATAPNNWLICDGSAVSRTTYNKLFAAIGTTYGTGDGSTTFNLPNLTGKVLVGSGTNYDIGDTGGEEEHTLTVNEMPSHTHDTGNLVNATGTTVSTMTASGGAYGFGYGNPGLLGSTGGDQPHNNMQPYVVTNYIIKYDDKEITGGQLQALTDFFYPIGSYYETSDATFNPNMSFGGTWISEEAADDYIIDEGTEDIWTFRKWASGIAECWGMWTTTTSNFFDWNNLARGYVGPVDFPNELFSETPVIMKKSATTSNAIMAEGNEHAAYGGGLPSKTNTGGMTLYSGDKTNYIGASFPITMKYYARGVWKTLDIDAKFKWHRTA